MHKIAIPQSIVDRVVARRGTAHPFAELDPKRTALVVVDMQNGFMRADLGFAPVPTAVEIVPAINRLATVLRDAGGAVFWIRNTFNTRSAAEWSVMEDYTLPERREARARTMSEGTEGHELWPELEVKPEDTVLRKYRYSAFIQGSSDLPRVLRERGFDTVLITGTLTNVCCESSARDAMMLNFRTVMVSDANAALTDEEHNATLVNFYASFGDVLSTEEIVDALGRADRKAAA